MASKIAVDEIIGSTWTGDLSISGEISNKQVCKAWCSWDQVTQLIKDGYNISSIADGGVGLTTVYFDVDMPDINYCMTCMADGGTSASGFVASLNSLSQLLVGSVVIKTTKTSDSTPNDQEYLSMQVFSK